MARQPKKEHRCPKCNGTLKRTIGAQTRKKFWECTGCGRRTRAGMVSDGKA